MWMVQQFFQEVWWHLRQIVRICGNRRTKTPNDFVQSKFSKFGLSCSQFHQHFTNSFLANFLVPKNYKHKLWVQKSFTIVQKAAHKMLVKLTPNKSAALKTFSKLKGLIVCWKNILENINFDSDVIHFCSPYYKFQFYRSLQTFFRSQHTPFSMVKKFKGV